MAIPLIYPYLKRRLPELGIATLCSIALGFASTVTFALIGPVFEVLGKPNDSRVVTFVELMGKNIGAWISQMTGRESMLSSELWSLLPILLIAAATVRAVLALAQWYLLERSSEKIAKEMRSDLVQAYITVDPEKRRGLNQEIDQEIGSAIGNDIRMVREFVVHFYGGFPRELIQVIFFLASLFYLDWKLSLIFIVGIGPAAAILSKLGKKLRKRSQAALGNSSGMLEWLQQRMSGIETIKQFQTEAIEQERMEKKSGELLKNFLKAARVKARTSPLLEVVATAAMVVVLIYALGAIARKEMSGSTLLSFLVLLGVLSQSASKLGRYFNSNKEGEAALNRLNKIMTAMNSVAASEIPMHCDKDLPEALTIENLSYAYDPDASPALKDFSAKFERGKIYAVAGPSGSGKSTLVKLLLGLWHPGKGSVTFGIKGREELGYLPQNVQLLPGPLVGNIVYPQLEFDTERLRESLRKVGMLEFIEALPKKWMSEVGEGGDIVLSGGQAQRLQIARLIYFAYPLLVIDEGTSALDPEVETLVLRTLQDMARAGSTIIMVAHRVAVLQLAEQVFVLKNGSTQYVGEPKEFLKRPDWRSYFEMSED
ncbi:MAG: ABC transporter ATP-binding protein [Proteobacteria bacterium]|nr:MAG: ABC transporter ATP-binding protein [Pseudomonadota bacterium]